MYTEYELKQLRAIEMPDNVYYMFFSDGMLNWVLKACSFIPHEQPVFMVAAGLSIEDRIFAEEHFKNIFFIREKSTDQEILDLLFRTNQKNFGWIDADCFIFDTTVFQKLSCIESSDFMNCYRSFISNDKLFLRTFLMFFNIEAVQAIHAICPEITPHTYSYTKQTADRFKARVIQESLYCYIEKVFPLYQYPEYDNIQKRFFDTLLLYQVIAVSLGYTMKSVQNKYHPDDSLQLFHPGGAYYFSSPFLLINVGKVKTQMEQPPPPALTGSEKVIFNIRLIITASFTNEFRRILPSAYLQIQKYIILYLRNQSKIDVSFGEYIQDSLKQVVFENSNFDNYLESFLTCAEPELLFEKLNLSLI